MSEPGSQPGRRLRVQLVPWMVAGVQTQFVHLRNELARADIDVSVTEVRPWIRDGLIERLPLPARTRGTIRSVLAVSDGSRRRPDAVWSQVALPLVPSLLTRRWPRGTPIFYAIDCTPKLLFELGPHYAGVATDPASVKGRAMTSLLRRFFRHCAGLLPWSEWAARSMIEHYGADAARVKVLPPGIDVDRWRPPSAPRERRLPRLLFVGADFERKGGALLLDVYRRHLTDTCALDLVTKADVSEQPGVTVHAEFSPDDPALLALYQASDVLVVPTYADCFSMAAIEAMACGLPVITCPVGGIPDVVADRQTGALVPAGDGTALRSAIESMIGDVTLRHRLGQAGRERAVQRFNAATQARTVAEIIANAVGCATAPMPASV